MQYVLPHGLESLLFFFSFRKENLKFEEIFFSPVNTWFLSFPITFESLQEEIQSQKTEINEKKKKNKPVTPPFCGYLYQSLSDDQGQDWKLSPACHLLLLLQPISLGYCLLTATPNSHWQQQLPGWQNQFSFWIIFIKTIMPFFNLCPSNKRRWFHCSYNYNV